ncbi:SLAP domain-containing protein [Companilactobacillus jidongensis]|uniref:SLAP domain-containing protein n=1 Tax=Companilactobacillus jidongensis TaxID=2486006 RepID=UPI000F76D777|nr:SLAP domain-containing protein [Companilactobacillus jidongensis]
MKSLLVKSMTVSGIALAAFVTSSVLSQDVDAASVATTKDVPVTYIYTKTGQQIKNRGLQANSGWRVGKTITVNGTTMYQVATNEYLKANDSILSDNTPHSSNGSFVATVHVSREYAFTHSDNDDSFLGVVENGTSWKVGRVLYESATGKTFYQIGSHLYIDAVDTTINVPESSISKETIKDINTVNVTYQPDVSKINEYFVKYLNALHKANGTTPVSLTDDMMSYAQQRANQQEGHVLDHSTAARKTSEDLDGTGLDGIVRFRGIRSDKDAAYYFLKDWYDDDYNSIPMGQAGHFGHRAALIYSGPTVGLGISEDAAAFTADWNYSTIDQYDALYNYTGSNPNTKFISKDSVQ